jgi:3-phosphoshikimate 1-carboxyvinyltransferase
MVKYQITKKDSKIKGMVNIPPTRTVSYKQLVIRVLKDTSLKQSAIQNDTEGVEIINHDIFKKGLKGKSGRSAQALRHIQSFIKYFGGEWVISSSNILKGSATEKIATLLQKNGLEVKYEERFGNPPLRIIGKNLRGKILRVEGSIYSKMIEARMLINPQSSIDDIEELKDWILKEDYPTMTLRALQFMGVNVDWDENEVLIEHQINDGSELNVEADWSLSSYWYEAVALSEKGEVEITGLKPDSFQCDTAVINIFENLGVKTLIKEDSVIIKRKGKVANHFSYDFKNQSDLAPAVLFTCLGLGIPFSITGTEKFHTKEPDRLEAIQKEFEKIGAKIIVKQENQTEILEFDGKSNLNKLKQLECDSQNDHRVAMSLAPFAILGKKIVMDNARITSKSYTTFWEEIKKLDFEVTILQ